MRKVIQPKTLYWSFLLFIFALAGWLCLLPGCQPFKDKGTYQPPQRTVPERTGTEEVHALLILLGNDRKISATVDATESNMLLLLGHVSKYCKVNLTLMKSEDEAIGRVTQRMLQHGRTQKTDDGTVGGIITSTQVVDWLQKLNPGDEDTVLIYYNGHGKIGGLGTHLLQFDPYLTQDTLDREKLGQRLAQKRARLRMLITDTCSKTLDSKAAKFATLAIETRRRKLYYMDDLFLDHEGFLNITAASPGELAIGNPDLGGHFTNALFRRGCTSQSDKNQDGFISWKEAFEATVSETRSLFRLASRELAALDGQNTQTPVAHSLPTRVGDGGGGTPKTLTGRDGGEMVLIPAGEFQMGSNDSEADDREKPVHTVYLDAFYIDKYAVTVGQYKQFIQATGHRALPDRVSEYSPTDRHPVVCVNWHDAMAYAKWAGKRLPTEAEWEYAARGGLIGKKYPWGDAIDSSKANYKRNADKTTPVGSYPPNGYGLYDMAGNVWEWCLDEFNKGFYFTSPHSNPVAGGTITSIINNSTNVKTPRVLRGGSWGYGPGSPRVAYRNTYYPTYTHNAYGFRCARALTP